MISNICFPCRHSSSFPAAAALHGLVVSSGSRSLRAFSLAPRESSRANSFEVSFLDLGCSVAFEADPQHAPTPRCSTGALRQDPRPGPSKNSHEIVSPFFPWMYLSGQKSPFIQRIPKVKIKAAHKPGIQIKKQQQQR